MSQFKEGDVVIAKTGGPAMTVEILSKAPDRVHVVWFDRDYHLHRDVLHPDAVTQYRAVSP